MKPIKTTLFFITMLCLLTSVSQCSNAQKLEHCETLEQTKHCNKKRVQAIKDLEGSLSIYIPLKEGSDKTIELDSVYFKGKSAKLMFGTEEQMMFFARFVTNSKHTQDIILSSDMTEEHQNKLPNKQPKIPFELKPDECVISYKANGETKYYKISGIKEKRLKEVPMAPRNNP